MDFIEELQALSTRIAKSRDMIQTEEAAKNAFVLPFIRALGYDIFDPMEVVPEFVCDVGTKKGEKVDYAIMRDGKVAMLIECKQSGIPLDIEHADQLFRYFHVTTARIAILTNGAIYRFYTDLESPNKMDSKPFMEFDMLNMDDSLVPELKRLSKKAFNLDEIITVAGELKFTREIKRIMGEQFSNPSDDFVRFFVSRVYSGRLTQSVREQFTEITKRALTQFLNERINERLRSAMAGGVEIAKSEPPTEAGKKELLTDENARTDSIETTEEELEAFYVVKAILREVVDPGRIAQRDQRSYFTVLLDDTNRKPICRLYFNRKQKYIGLFDKDKQEERIPINVVDDIYAVADRLKATVFIYEGKATNSA